MVASFKHQGLCKLLGERPEHVPTLLRTLLGITLLGDSKLVPAPETIRDPKLPEHAADVVLANPRATDGTLLEAFAFEVQLRPDSDKRWSWPIHVAGLRARLSCPTTLIVVATDERTARWAAQPIEMGRNDMVLRPLVIGPGQVPSVLELDEARVCPELATLAVVMHGHRPGSKRLGRIAIEAVLEGLENHGRRDILLLELILSSLPASTLREIEDEMDLHTAPLLSKWSKQRIAQGRAQGRQEGRRKALRLVLGARGLALSPAQRERVEQCTDSAQLDQWLRRAVIVEDVEQLFEARAPRHARSRTAGR